MKFGLDLLLSFTNSRHNNRKEIENLLMLRISILIPVFRNYGTILPTYTTILDELNRISNEIPYEFIFVDDGSDDNSYEELLKIKNLDPDNVKVIKFSRNFGQFSALNAGVSHVLGDMVVAISADQQDPPSIVSEMYNKILEGNEVVLAQRIARNDSILKNLTAWLHVKLIRISTPSYPTGGFDCWCLSRKAINAYLQYSDTIRTNQVDILNIGFKRAIIQYKRKKREIGRSQYNFRKRLKVSMNQILATSSWPLRMVSIIGFLMTIIGFAFGARVFYGYFAKGTPFQGYTPIVLLQLIIGGIIMIMLGVIGEYQWRIYFETKRRPLYLIDEILD